MREIKFRAFDKLEGKMCPVDVLSFSGGGAFLVGNDPTPDESIRDDFGEKVGVRKGTQRGHFVMFPLMELMQSTGLEDRNGKMIFEGDILKQNYQGREIIGPMIWNKARAQFGLSAVLDFKSGRHIEIFESRDGRPEIIGNVFMNKDLLKDGQE